MALINTAEAGRREGRDRRFGARLAAGECAEAGATVRNAQAWSWGGLVHPRR